MKFLLLLSLILSFSFETEKKPAPLQIQKSQMMDIKGFPGQMIDLCIDKRVKGRDVDELIEPFELKDETRCWQSEFWGKWMLSAVLAYQYHQDPELMEKMQHAVEGLLATQQPDGHIGNYGPKNQLTGWDIWGRKYTMLGLIKYHEISGDKKALKAATRVADKLISQVGPDKTNIVKTGFYRGMPSSSVLEPIVYLYNHTGEEKYLDFARYIVAQWETEEGPKLISKALEGIAVKDRFPKPDKWWSWENGQKAYEMMSCYDGLLELYKVTKTPDYLKAIIATVDNIIATEINIAGSGSAFECWYGTVDNQTRPTYHTMETCVTVTWMKLCNSLLEVTGNPKYADQIEFSFYNALMASMKNDASEIAKYSPLEGVRHAGEDQCNMHINCCNANGPRGFAMMPAFGLKTMGNEVFVNYYGASKADFMLEGNNKVTLSQQTNYPVSGSIEMEIASEKPVEFTLNLRIPAWSKNTSAKVNDEALSDLKAGQYHKITRKWSKGDVLVLDLDMRGRLYENNLHQAIKRGPVTLARYSIFNDGFVDETAIIQAKEGYVELLPVNNLPSNIWMAYTAPCIVGTDLEGAQATPTQIIFCDFASAGNTWDATTRYRVWIPKTINVMNMDYEHY